MSSERIVGDRRCRICGCSEFDACPGGCSWVWVDLCSACASPSQLRAAFDRVLAAGGRDPGTFDGESL